MPKIAGVNHLRAMRALEKAGVHCRTPGQETRRHVRRHSLSDDTAEQSRECVHYGCPGAKGDAERGLLAMWQ